jgi:hypothetical protein
MFLVESDIFGWACLQDSCLPEKGETNQNRSSNVSFLRREKVLKLAEW